MTINKKEEEINSRCVRNVQSPQNKNKQKNK